MIRKKKVVDEKLVLLDATINDIAKYQEKPTSEFYNFANKFFSKYLELKYELTYNELIEEIDKTEEADDTKQKVKDMCESFLEVRYHHKPEEDVPVNLIEEFKDVVKALKYNHIISKQKNKQHKSHFAWVKKLWMGIIKIFVFIFTGIIKIIILPFLLIAKGFSKIFRARGEKIEAEIAGVKLLVDEVYDLFESKEYDKVKTKYSQLMTEYNSLSPKQKENIYAVIKDLHGRLTATTPQEDQLAQLIEEAHFLFENKDFAKTKDKYLKIFELYNALNPEKRESFYERIVQLHQKITSI